MTGTNSRERVSVLLEKMKLVSPFNGMEIIGKEKIIEATIKSGSTTANPKKIERADVEILLSNF